MTKQRSLDVEHLDRLIGRTVSNIRVARTDSQIIQRVVLMFDDGASLAIDGQFPANSRMTSSSEPLDSVVNETVKGISCIITEPSRKKNDRDRYEEELQVKLILNDRELLMTWHCVGNVDFDVSPHPSFAFRPADGWEAGA